MSRQSSVGNCETKSGDGCRETKTKDNIMSEAAKKGLYHGEFLKMRQPVTVTVNEEEKESSKKKGSFYVTLTIAGAQRYYNVENEACGSAFAGQKGKTISVMVEGSREDATITVVGAPASQLAQPPPRGQQAARPTHQPPAEAGRAFEEAKVPASKAPQTGDALTNAKKFVARNRVLAMVALEAAYLTKIEFEQAKNFDLPQETFTALFASMLYGAAQAGHTAQNQGLPLDHEFKKIELPAPKPPVT